MDAALFLRTFAGLGRYTGDHSRFRRGFTLVETSVTLGILGVLGSLGVATLDFGRQDLTAAQTELQGALFEAFHLAWAQGKNVTVALGEPGTPGIVPVRLSPRIKWGKPASIPVPPGMDAPVVAGTTGEAHARITVTPRHTATACAWFLNDGQEVLCMRLSGKGHIQMLRWHKSSRKWRLS